MNTLAAKLQKEIVCKLELLATYEQYQKVVIWAGIDFLEAATLS